MTLRIRDAAPADAAIIAAIEIASKVDSLPDLTEAAERDEGLRTARWLSYLVDGSRAQHSRGDGFALLADLDGRAVGFLAWHHTTRLGADAELQSMYVLRDAQRRGVGSALLAALFERLPTDGSRGVCVGFDPRNPYRRFYLERGAEPVGEHWAVWHA